MEAPKMKQVENGSKFDWRVVDLAWRMGYTIALPIVLLALGGRLLDKRLGTSPIFLLIGILASLAISTIGIYRIAAPIIDDLGKPDTSDSKSQTSKDNDTKDNA